MQYSLRTLFLLTTIISVCLFIFFYTHGVISSLLMPLVFIVLPMSLVALIVVRRPKGFALAATHGALLTVLPVFAYFSFRLICVAVPGPYDIDDLGFSPDDLPHGIVFVE